MEAVVVYIEAVSICILIMSIILLSSIKKWHLKITSSLVIVMSIAVLSALCDCVWRVIDGIQYFRVLNIIVSSFYMILSSFLGYYWMSYCNEHLPMKFYTTQKSKLFCLIPPIIITIIILTSPATKLIIYIDELGYYHRGTIHFIVSIINYMYVIVTSIFAFISCQKTNIKSEKREYLTLALFALPPLVMNIIQIFTPPGFPTTHFGMLIGFFIVYTVTLEKQVTRDKLTNLPNRYAFEEVLNDNMAKFKHNKICDLYLLMGDLDKFKVINDTFGHVEGDVALKLTGKILMQACDKFGCFAARLGGDEFVIVIEETNEEVVKNLIQLINIKLNEVSKRQAYNLVLSIGYSTYDGEMNLEEFLQESDKQLYKVKQAKKSELEKQENSK